MATTVSLPFGRRFRAGGRHRRQLATSCINLNGRRYASRSTRSPSLDLAQARCALAAPRCAQLQQRRLLCTPLYLHSITRLSTPTWILPAGATKLSHCLSIIAALQHDSAIHTFYLCHSRGRREERTRGGRRVCSPADIWFCAAGWFMRTFLG